MAIEIADCGLMIGARNRQPTVAIVNPQSQSTINNPQIGNHQSAIRILGLLLLLEAPTEREM